MSQPAYQSNGAESNGRHFPTPYNGAGLLWTGKKSGKEVEKRAVTQTLTTANTNTKKNPPPTKKTQMKKKQLASYEPI